MNICRNCFCTFPRKAQNWISRTSVRTCSLVC